MAATYPTISQSAIAAGALKILLWPAYRSTDFEVHRNWLAITHSLPVKEWYYEKTSEWTLDYPPFFAAWEWLLSQAARLVDSQMLVVSNPNYDSWQTVYFQRASVMLSELVLVYALICVVQSAPVSGKKQAHAIALSILLSPGFLIIDHIHFQYNGAMYGILLLSITYARKQSALLLSGILFAILLCFKHIYLYLAPAYFVYLLRAYCLGRKSIFHIQLINCIKLGLSIVAVAGIAFGPFIYYQQVPQVLERLFPFSRGLCHAYWAPNIWALYSFTDRMLIYAAPYLKLSVNKDAISSVTRGLVGDTAFAVLPEITPRTTFALTLGAQLPAMLKTFINPSWDNFVATLTLCGYASFLFGWHVHEKAILLVIIPFSLLALEDRRYLGAFKPLAVAGHVSLFPLLFTTQEYPVKVMYTVAWVAIFLISFEQLAPASTRVRFFLLDRFSLLYNLAAIPVVLYSSILHELIFGSRLEFLPLMLVSVYSAVAVCGSWLSFLVVFFTS